MISLVSVLDNAWRLFEIQFFVRVGVYIFKKYNDDDATSSTLLRQHNECN